MALTLARFNMIDPGDGVGSPPTPEALSDRYNAMIDMAVYADEQAMFGISLEEHHGAANGWSPTPLINAAAILARTKTITCNLSALLLPLHDPIRIAEDIAVLDLISRGRVNTILGLGYRPEEYHLHQKDWAGRGRLFDESIDTLLKAWSGEPFEYRGQTVQVTPRPYTEPHPFLMLGGSSKVACRRAARFGLPISLAAHLPELEPYYYEKCEEYGTQGFMVMPGADTAMLFVSEDPDKTWAELGQYFLNEASTYSSWQTADIKSAVGSSARTPKELRAEGIYKVQTPTEVVDEVRSKGDAATVVLHPLVGGMPIDAGWSCMQLFAEQVLPKLTEVN